MSARLYVVEQAYGNFWSFAHATPRLKFARAWVLDVGAAYPNCRFRIRKYGPV